MSNHNATSAKRKAEEREDDIVITPAFDNLLTLLERDIRMKTSFEAREELMDMNKEVFQDLKYAKAQAAAAFKKHERDCMVSQEDAKEAFAYLTGKKSKTFD